jgi:hypothetical protein
MDIVGHKPIGLIYKFVMMENAIGNSVHNMCIKVI